MKATRKHVLVTRPAHQANQLSELLRSAGFQPIAFPTIEIVPLPLDDSKRNLLRKIDTFDYILFISANAVQHATAYNIKWPESNTRYIAIGPKTAEAMLSINITADFIAPKPFNSEQLLTQLNNVSNKHILIIKGEHGRNFLANQLKNKGMFVEHLDTYQRQLPTIKANDIALSDVDYITITSELALKNLAQLVGKQFLSLSIQCVFVVFSQRIEKYAKQLGCQHTLVANNVDNASLVEAIKQSQS